MDYIFYIVIVLVGLGVAITILNLSMLRKRRLKVTVFKDKYFQQVRKIDSPIIEQQPLEVHAYIEIPDGKGGWTRPEEPVSFFHTKKFLTVASVIGVLMGLAAYFIIYA